MKILITGVDGLLGQHAHALLFSANAAAKFRSENEPFMVVPVNRALFNNESKMCELLRDADAVLHFAGVNRGTESEVANGNQGIARTLVANLEKSGSKAHIVYANSTHSLKNNTYGAGKKETAQILNNWATKTSSLFTDLVFPHIFGEGGTPFYNTVTATLCHQIVKEQVPEINPAGVVELLHAGSAATIALNSVLNSITGVVVPKGTEISISDLYTQLKVLHSDYVSGLLPELVAPFQVQLFNTLRSAMFPDFYAKQLIVHSDARGQLFEAVKGGQGQTFLSWTKPGVTRGDHFHRSKIERFLVVSGQATIRIRHIFKDTVHEFEVTGENPSYVDMPTLHTHSIENTGLEPLLTMFWAHEIFDPENPDTFAELVIT